MIRIWESLLRAGESMLRSPAVVCSCCRAEVRLYGERELALCRRCAMLIPWIDRPLCHHCGRAVQCGDCERSFSTELVLNRGAVRYTEDMKQWLSAYKYKRDERLQHLFAAMMVRTYKRYMQDYTSTGAIDWITAVPVSLSRLEERGYNQAEQLAACIARQLGISSSMLLKRQKATGKQSAKSRSERFLSLRGAFAAEEDGMRGLLTKRTRKPINILIVDDVYTTGSTLHHCAQIIRDYADANVYGLTWAR